MIKSVVDYRLAQLFDNQLRIFYQIPRYQRPYKWTKKQWEQLFDDILENESGYFLGSIICINQSQDSHAAQALELIDGQQRMTTLAILLGAIYFTLSQYEDGFDEEQKHAHFSLKRRLVLKGTLDSLRIIPQVHESNQADFQSLMAAYRLISQVPQLPNAGNRRMWRAATYFERRLQQLCPENDPATACKELLVFLDRILATVIVKIEVGSHADAYTLFESLNNRGEKLTGVDLIKNKMLASLEQSDPGQIEAHFDQWNALIAHLGSDETDQERFFRHFYNGFRSRLKEVVNVPVATGSNLIKIYEKLINHDARGCLSQLATAAQQYALLLADGQPDPSKKLEYAFLNLLRVQGAPGYLLALNLLVRQKELGLDAKRLTSIVGVIVRFFARRNITDLPPTRDLTRLFMAIVEDLTQQAATGDEVEQLIRQHLIDASASDDVFREKLRGPVYDENTPATRFLLCSLAEEGMTRESWVDLWKVNGKHYDWTIEHIFPQGANIPRAWIDMIADGDAELATEYQESCGDMLGNLTLSAYNSALSNMPFEKKRDRIDRKGLPVGYKNNFCLNRDLAKAKSWTVQQIKKRTEDLVKDALRLFDLNR